MRELSKPSCLVITKVLFAQQNKVYGLSKIPTSFLAIANTTDGNQLTFPSVLPSASWLTLIFRAKNAVVDPGLLGNLSSVMTKTSAA